MKASGFDGSSAAAIASLRSNRPSFHGLFALLWVSLFTAVALLPAVAAAAAEVATVVVRLPITGNRDEQIEASILRRLDRLGRGNERPLLILSFTKPEGDQVAATDFGRALELARFLGSPRLDGVRTVAFVPDGVSGHALLPALACEEIVTGPDAVLGPATAEDPNVDDAMRAAYVQVAGRRRTVPPAVALALVDPQASLVQVSTDAGVQLVAAADVAAIRARAAVLAVEPIEPLPLALGGRRARELGIVRLLAATPAELARSLQIDERAVLGDPSQDGGWRAAQVVVSGPITPDRVARVKQHLDRLRAEGKNFVCLRIDSAGGSFDQSLLLAGHLAGFDSTLVRTVAYVPSQARGDAALIALACDELVMHPDAVLGGAGDGTMSERQADAVAFTWQNAVAKPRSRSWSLPVSLAVPGIEVLQATQAATGRTEYFSPGELDERDDRDTWKTGAKVGVGPIQLTGRSAESLGLATHLVDGPAAFAREYALADGMDVAAPRWSDTLLDALANPGLAWLLLFIGVTGLYIELHTPGVGLGGFVSMVAFIIYFWSQYLHGTAGWLEPLLFVAGLFCLAAEIFVLPGFGVLGLGGAVLVLVSLVLASQSFVLPTNDYQIRQLQWTLIGSLGLLVGVGVVGLLLRRWLPSIPLFRGIVLEPPAGAADSDDDDAALVSLVGREGVATTRLAPAGKARIDGRVIDVVSDGFVEPGAAVTVVELRGTRVIVRGVAGRA
jgi:membrane-bound serine protease (ClpP class)